MSTVEESPAQRAARMRRERREAKIKEGGAARLDKITSMSGRTPAAERQEQDASSASAPSPSPSPQPPASTSPGPETQSQPTTAANQPEPPIAPTHPFPDTQAQSPESLQAQQEAFRALLRQAGPPPAPGQGGALGAFNQGNNAMDEDPTVKLLNSLMGGLAAGDGPGDGNGGGNGNGGPPISQADIATALGLPPFMASMLPGGSQPQTESEKTAMWVWKILHVVFAVAVGVYFLVLMGSSVSLYGQSPPPPATARNPFMFFMTGEMVMTGARVFLKRGNGQAGLALYFNLFRDVVRDGSLVVFLLGMGAWWNAEWMV